MIPKNLVHSLQVLLLSLTLTAALPAGKKAQSDLIQSESEAEATNFEKLFAEERLKSIDFYKFTLTQFAKVLKPTTNDLLRLNSTSEGLQQRLQSFEKLSERLEQLVKSKFDDFDFLMFTIGADRQLFYEIYDYVFSLENADAQDLNAADALIIAALKRNGFDELQADVGSRLLHYYDDFSAKLDRIQDTVGEKHREFVTNFLTLYNEAKNAETQDLQLGKMEKVVELFTKYEVSVVDQFALAE